MKIQYYTIYASIEKKYLYIDEYGYASHTSDLYKADRFKSINEAFSYFQINKSKFHRNTVADYHVVAVWTETITSFDKLKTKSEVMKEKYNNNKISAEEYIAFLESNQSADKTLYEE